MKKDFNLTKLFYSFAIAFSVVTLSSCNNDDNSPLPPPSTNDVAGTYNGKVLITQVTPATVKCRRSSPGTRRKRYGEK